MIEDEAGHDRAEGEMVVMVGEHRRPLKRRLRMLNTNENEGRIDGETSPRLTHSTGHLVDEADQGPLHQLGIAVNEGPAESSRSLCIGTAQSLRVIDLSDLLVNLSLGEFGNRRNICYIPL